MRESGLSEVCSIQGWEVRLGEQNCQHSECLGTNARGVGGFEKMSELLGNSGEMWGDDWWGCGLKEEGYQFEREREGF